VTGDGRNDIVFGSFNHHIYVIDGHCNQLADYDNGDTVWSAPALYDVDRDGAKEIFIGGDSTAGAPGTYHNGGIFRSLKYQAGKLVERWERNDSNEDFQNGSAIGDLEGNGRLAVVNRLRCLLLAGTRAPGAPIRPRSGRSTSTTARTCRAGPRPRRTRPSWRRRRSATSTATGNSTSSSGPSTTRTNQPVGGGGRCVPQREQRGTGHLEVTPGGGRVADHRRRRRRRARGGRRRSILDKGMNVVGTYTGNNKDAVGGRQARQRVRAGQRLRGHGLRLLHPHPHLGRLAAVREQRPALGTSLAGPPRCTVGYRTVAADGGMFIFGNASFQGSAGSIRLNSPVVGMAGSPSGPGYWLVARDGGIFNYGVAFSGSAGSIRLNSPVVGMAATASGGGYWLTGGDGGIFNYGDAPFLGSTGSIHLNSPVVGIAAAPSSTATPYGIGYWFVARDGGVFNYGLAGFHGSTGSLHLNSPVVGMATHALGGRLLAGRRGRRGLHVRRRGLLRLHRLAPPHHSPIVGMQRTPTGAGYWLVAADGGVFSFGRCAVLRLGGRHPPELADGRHGLRGLDRRESAAGKLRRRRGTMIRCPYVRSPLARGGGSCRKLWIAGATARSTSRSLTSSGSRS